MFPHQDSLTTQYELHKIQIKHERVITCSFSIQLDIGSLSQYRVANVEEKCRLVGNAVEVETKPE